MRYKTLLFILLLWFSCGFSQQQETLPPIAEKLDSVAVAVYENTLPADSLLKKNPETNNTIYPKKLNPNFKNKFKGDEFDYTTIKPKESIWEKITRNLNRILRSIFGDLAPMKANNFVETIFKILAIVIIGFVVYFIINYLISKDGNFIFGKKNKKLNLQNNELNENIHEIDFPKNISDAEFKKDFRSAIRYQYLFVLKKLSDKKLIEWNFEKTNKDYVNEFKNSNLKDDFKNLSYIFDYVWYGEFEIEQEGYRNFKRQFDEFKI